MEKLKRFQNAICPMLDKRLTARCVRIPHLSNYRSAAQANLQAQLPRCCPPQQNTLKQHDLKCWMCQNTRDVHGGLMGAEGGMSDFKVSRTFQKCVPRQIFEGFRIKRREDEGCVLLNSRNEWFTLKLVEPSTT